MRIDWIVPTLAVLLCSPVAFAELGDKEFNSAKKRAAGSLKAGDATSAASALAELATDDSARAVKFFLSMAKVPDHSIYSALRDGLGSMGSEGAKAEMLKAMDKGAPLAKLLVIDAMETRSDEFPAKVLSAAMDAKQDEIQRAAIMVTSRKKIRPVCGAMISLLKRLEKKDGDGLNANMIRKALQELTHESFETAGDWEKYWASNSEGNAAKSGGGEGGGERGGTKRRKRPTFYGSEILSKRVVFVIDTSLSMDADQMRATKGMVYPEGQGPPRVPTSANTQIERAKAQLKQVVSALPKGSRFGIISYSAPKNGQTPLPKGEFPPEINKFKWLKVWSPKLVPASKGSIAKANAFIETLYADGQTFTLRGIEAAFKIPDVDTIVLLSDGAPNDIDVNTHAKLTTDEILERVKKMNRKRRLVIDTFGILPPGAENSNLGKFLKDLAKQNGGKFVITGQKKG